MIHTPTLILDVEKCKKNIKKMALKAQEYGLVFRPHFKTHQSLEIGRWFKQEGVTKITVSSLQMASYFAEEWNDITVAFPVNILESDTINRLANKVTLNLLIESAETALFLKQHLTESTGVFIKIDTGYHRTGVDAKNIDTLDSILDVVDSADHLDFKGFLAHSGHTYKYSSKKAIMKIHHECKEALTSLKMYYQKRYENIIVSLGDTPSCSIAEDFEGVDEIRPGNFVFYDLMQHKIGSNSIDEIAVGVACPIVAIHKDRNEIVVYGGGVHLSKERLEKEKEGIVYGRVAKSKGISWEDLEDEVYVKSLSQEHGIIKAPDTFINQHKVGDCLMILPVHSCMTANLMKEYITQDGQKIKMMPYPYDL